MTKGPWDEKKTFPGRHVIRREGSRLHQTIASVSQLQGSQLLWHLPKIQVRVSNIRNFALFTCLTNEDYTSEPSFYNVVPESEKLFLV